MNQDPDLDGYTAQKNTSDSVDAIQEQIGIALTAHDAHCNDKPIAQLAARFDKLNSQAGKATVFSSRIGTPCVGKYVLISTSHVCLTRETPCTMHLSGTDDADPWRR